MRGKTAYAEKNIPTGCRGIIKTPPRQLRSKKDEGLNKNQAGLVFHKLPGQEKTGFAACPPCGIKSPPTRDENMSESNLYSRIEEIRRELGTSLTIMGHHYQADEVIRHTDLRGDSLQLAREAGNVKSQTIVFCGVYFMAESAALLARQGQRVHIPEPSAECVMALMSPAHIVENALKRLNSGSRRVIPLAYVNSTLDVKSVVGRYGGSVCTSSNAQTMLKWALDRGDAVLFLPDKNLGWNTADSLGMPVEERNILAIRNKGHDLDPVADEAKLLLWPGFCYIHTRFNTYQVELMREKHPEALLVVHPECTPEVVEKADAAGSTSFIIKYAEEAPSGSTLIIGTEIHLVNRLARQHEGRINIVPLAESNCIHMEQTTEQSLANCLEAVIAGDNSFMVNAPEEHIKYATEALERMLNAS